MLNSRRYLSGSVASDWMCALVGAITALIVAVAAMAAGHLAIDASLDDLAQEADDAALTIAQSVAVDIGKAVALGIPLEEMRDVGPYLEEIMADAPEIAGIVVLSANEEPLFSSRPDATTIVGPHTRAPIVPAPDAAVVGTVRAHSSTIMRDAAERSVLCVGLVMALLAGLFVAIAMRVARLEQVDLPMVRTVAALNAAGRGHFVERGLGRSGLLPAVADALARAITPLQLTNRRIRTLVDEIKAVDGSTPVRQRVAAIVAPLDGELIEHRPAPRRTLGNIWWPIAALALVMAARPLIGNFAYDRIGYGPWAETVVAIGCGAAAAGAGLGILAAMTLAGRWSKLVSALAMLVVAGAFASVYQIRDYRVFALTIMVANFAGWLAVWTVLYAEGAGRRRPWRAALVLLAAAAIGPMVGGLLAEAEGRRAAFATLGAVALLLGFAALTEAPRLRRVVRSPARLRPTEALALVAVSAAAFAWCDISLAAGVLRERYSAMALAFGLCGVAAFVPYVLRLRLPAWIGAAVASAGLGGAGFGLAAPGADGLIFAISAALGLGFGLVSFRLGARAFTARSALLLALGALLAAAFHFAATVSAGGGLVLGTLAVAVLALLSALAAMLPRQAGRAR